MVGTKQMENKIRIYKIVTTDFLYFAKLNAGCPSTCCWCSRMIRKILKYATKVDK